MPRLHAYHCDVNEESPPLFLSRNDLTVDIDESKAAYIHDTFLNDASTRLSPSSSVNSLSWSLVSNGHPLEERTPQSALSTWSKLDAYDTFMHPLSRVNSQLNSQDVANTDIRQDFNQFRNLGNDYREYVHDVSEAQNDVNSDLDDEFELVQATQSFQFPHRPAPVSPNTLVSNPKRVHITLAVDRSLPHDTLSQKTCLSVESIPVMGLRSGLHEIMADMTLAEQPRGDRIDKQGNSGKISPESSSRQRYETLFDAIHDEGLVDGETVQLIWCRSRLSRVTLGYIWHRCDPKGRGVLDKSAFSRGMGEIDALLFSRETSRKHKS